MTKEMIGTVSDFFAHPVVAAIELTGGLKVGDKLSIQGHTTDLELVVQSMQIENSDVEQAKAGDSVGVKVPERVRTGDTVYKMWSKFRLLHGGTRRRGNHCHNRGVIKGLEGVADGGVYVCVVLELAEEGVVIVAEEDVCAEFDCKVVGGFVVDVGAHVYVLVGR